MLSDVEILFESSSLSKGTYPVLCKNDLMDKVRFLISPERPEGLSRSKHVMLLPYVLRSCDESSLLQRIQMEEPENVMVRNLEELGLLKSAGFKGRILSDHCLYSFNEESRRVLHSFGVFEDTLSLESSFNDIKNLDLKSTAIVIYGRSPLMVSAQCIHKTKEGECARKSGGFMKSITDRKKVRFPVKAECDYCYNVIYNSVPLSLHKELGSIKKLSPKALRLDLTTENVKEAASLAEAFILEKDPESHISGFTKGHFKKGVE